jgi:UDPglucose 6-dehydrogenase
VQVYDPVVSPDVVSHPRLAGASSALDACSGADGLVIMTPWPEFRALPLGELSSRMRGRVIIDPFAMLDGAACRAAGFRYLTLGAGSVDAC